MDGSQCRYVVRYAGHVQGVGFRMTAIQQADQLSISGFVRNESDGSVLLDVEGPIEDVRELMRRIETVMADKIDSVDARQSSVLRTSTGFRITY